MPSRTGTASQADGSAGDGSTSVTVPADATCVACFFEHWDDVAGAGSTVSSLTLGGSALAFQSQKAVGWTGGDVVGCGVAFLNVLPGTGAQTFAWTYSAGGARGQGGKFILVWVKDHNPSDPVRDADSTSALAANDVELIVNTETDDLLLACATSFGADPGLIGTLFIDNAPLNSERYDASQVTPGSPTTTVTMTGEAYSSMTAISLKAFAAAAGVENRFLTRHSRMTSW